jgi:hypothetical protein
MFTELCNVHKKPLNEKWFNSNSKLSKIIEKWPVLRGILNVCVCVCGVSLTFEFPFYRLPPAEAQLDQQCNLL